MRDQQHITLPQSTADITLGRWIDFTGSEVSKELDKQLTEAGNVKGAKRDIRLTTVMVEQAYNALSYFNGVPVDELKEFLPVDYVVNLYLPFNQMFIDPQPISIEPWSLPSAELSAQSPINFGQFIDSKIITQAINQADSSKWALLQYICAIYLRKDNEQYSDAFIDDDNPRMTEMAELPMSQALTVMQFYEQLNAFLSANFSLFWETGEKSGVHMRKHFEQWGWVNFLKGIAKTKVFDIPASGLNSIECARAAKLYEVLIYGSEDKDYNTAMIKDMDK